MADEEIEAAKVVLRAHAHKRRAAISPDMRAEAAKAACNHFFSGILMDPGAIVAAYWRIRDELDCQPILLRLMESGQPVCLPVVLGDTEPLEMRLWEESAPLYPSGFGTLAPDELAPKVEPDVVLVPLLGFDKHGTRLGYGGGYYDRTLASLGKKPKLVGLAFATQEIDEIPRDGHDVPLDAVVTETGVRHFDEATIGS
jgi:5-formyltetrahydrofolate cyclo-ligase